MKTGHITLFRPFYTQKRIRQCIIFVLCLYSAYLIYFNVELISFKNGFYQFNTIQSKMGRLKRNTHNRLIYILQWTTPDERIDLGKGQEVFLKTDCAFKNCFVTSNKTLLKRVSMYDIVTFGGQELALRYIKLPKERSKNQKYMFISPESAYNYPICLGQFNNFFNLTWTYKFNSDLTYHYIYVKDESGNIIGPKPIMHWMDVKDMKPTSEDLKKRLMSKSRAAAWFVSNCRRRRWRKVRDIMICLKGFGFDIDIYGECGNFTCPRENMSLCNEKIQKDYFFYFAFENSRAADYVTEKIIHGLNNYAVPVVFGGANYTRFMPDGIYLDAGKMSPPTLAREMYQLITETDRKRYYDMFRWHNHYSFITNSELIETNPVCKLCELANSDLMKKTTQYPDFLRWWTEVGKKKRCFID